MLEEVWGREALDPLLYGSETARRRRPTDVSLEFVEDEKCNFTYLGLEESKHLNQSLKALEGRNCSVLMTAQIQH